MSEISCPTCGSKQITANKKGFSVGKAVGGAILTGGAGLLAGFHGSSDIEVTCLSCGKTWNPKKLKEQNGQEQRSMYAAKRSKWKSDFYRAYVNKDFIEADRVYKIMGVYNHLVPDVHAGYNKMRKEDKQNQIFIFSFMLIALIVFVWLAS